MLCGIAQHNEALELSIQTIVILQIDFHNLLLLKITISRLCIAVGLHGVQFKDRPLLVAMPPKKLAAIVIWN